MSIGVWIGDRLFGRWGELGSAFFTSIQLLGTHETVVILSERGWQRFSRPTPSAPTASVLLFFSVISVRSPRRPR